MTHTLDELDRMAAEKVMGWKAGQLNTWLSEDGYLTRYANEWQPTGNIAQAWEVMEKATDHFSIITWSQFPESFHNYDNGKYEVRIRMKEWPRDVVSIFDNSVPLAITKACLRAAGCEV